jgi:hypothetical protein
VEISIKLQTNSTQRPWDVPDVPGIKDMTYNQRNEAFEKSAFLQYWVINKKEKGEYSPPLSSSFVTRMF